MQRVSHVDFLSQEPMTIAGDIYATSRITGVRKNFIDTNVWYNHIGNVSSLSITDNPNCTFTRVGDHRRTKLHKRQDRLGKILSCGKRLKI